MDINYAHHQTQAHKSMYVVYSARAHTHTHTHYPYKKHFMHVGYEIMFIFTSPSKHMYHAHKIIFAVALGIFLKKAASMNIFASRFLAEFCEPAKWSALGYKFTKPETNSQNLRGCVGLCKSQTQAHLQTNIDMYLLIPFLASSRIRSRRALVSLVCLLSGP
jgi:hypothetical protein